MWHIVQATGGRWLIFLLILTGMLIAIAGHPPVGEAQATVNGIPSTSLTDGKFIGLAGKGLRTLDRPSSLFLGIPAGQSMVTVDVFDGDLGGLWDTHNQNTAPNAKVVYSLFATPTKSRSGGTLITTKTSADFRDNAWVTLFSGPADPRARAPSGNFFYRIEIGWENSDASAGEFNSYKIRADAQVTLTPGQWSFVGAPINIGTDPGLGVAGNSYNGDWHWYMYAPTAGTVQTTECDADVRTDPSSPGIPPDDDPSDARVQIAPDVRYALTNPNGTLLIFNLQPSGNDACQPRSYPGQPAGLYDWHWIGVDAHNLIFIDSLYEIASNPFTPLPVDAPTPTPPPITTPIQPTATPGSGGGGGGGAPPSTTTPTALPSPSPTPLPSLQPLATPTPAQQIEVLSPVDASPAVEEGPTQTFGTDDPSDETAPVKAPGKAPGQTPKSLAGGQETSTDGLAPRESKAVITSGQELPAELDLLTDALEVENGE